jgi:hypothetical protein
MHPRVELHNGKIISCETVDPMPVLSSNYFLEREVFELELWSTIPSSRYQLGTTTPFIHAYSSILDYPYNCGLSLITTVRIFVNRIAIPIAYGGS